jgi:hypothetical protein
VFSSNSSEPYETVGLRSALEKESTKSPQATDPKAATSPLWSVKYEGAHKLTACVELFSFDPGKKSEVVTRGKGIFGPQKEMPASRLPQSDR